MALPKIIYLGCLSIILLAFLVEAATPPGIAKNPARASCKDKKFKTCYNLEHVCPKFCPDSCTVECASCKPICGPGGNDTSSGSPPPSSPTPTPYYPPTPSSPTPYHPPIPTPPSSPTPHPTPTPPSSPTPSPPTPTPPSSPKPSPPTPTPPSSPKPSPPTPTPPSSPKPSPPTPTPPSSPKPSPPTPTPPSSPTPSPPTPTPPSSPKPSPPTPTPPSSPKPSPPTPTPPSSPPSSPPTPSSTPPSPTRSPPTPSTPPPTPPSPAPSPPTPSTPPPTPPSPTPSPPTPSTPQTPSTPPSSPYPTPPTPSTPPRTPSSPTPPSPTPPAMTPPTPSSTPPTPSPSTPSTPSSPPSFEVASRKRVRCKNKYYGQCYNQEHVCPASCPTSCQVDCVSCKPVCSCDYPGAVCQDPRFIGGDGITFYFHGKKDKNFCLVSDPNLHINAHFIGKRNANMTRDFTWVKSIGVLFDNHRLFLGARKTSTWNDANDRLALALDGEPIYLKGSIGSRWSSTSTPKVTITRTSETNNIIVEIKGKLKITTKVVPILEEESRVHSYDITKDDCFAHLDLGFKFQSLTERVDGVLGRTYRDDYVSRVKMGVAMPIMGGDREYVTSSIFGTDCLVSRFDGIQQGNSLEALNLASMNCGSGMNGEGVVCKR